METIVDPDEAAVAVETVALDPPIVPLTEPDGTAPLGAAPDGIVPLPPGPSLPVPPLDPELVPPLTATPPSAVNSDAGLDV